jgi:hypothetical protein
MSNSIANNIAGFLIGITIPFIVLVATVPNDESIRQYYVQSVTGVNILDQYTASIMPVEHHVIYSTLQDPTGAVVAYGFLGQVFIKE